MDFINKGKEKNMDSSLIITEQEIKKKLEELLRNSENSLEFNEKCISEFSAMGITLTSLNSLWSRKSKTKSVFITIDGYPEVIISVSIKL